MSNIQKHFHSGVDAVIVYGVSAMLFFHAMRMLAAPLAKRKGPVGTAGRLVGGLFSFPASNA